MKICLINNLFKPYERGGADRIAETLYQGLRRREYEIFSISLRPLFSKPKNISNRYYISSVFFYLNYIPKFFRLFYHLWDFFNIVNYLKIRHILKKEKPDLIISNNLKGIGYPIFLLLRRLKIKHIHILHDIQLIHPSGLLMHGKEKKLNSIFTAVYSFLSRIFCSSPQIVISPSSWLLSLHAKRGFFKKAKLLVLPNPIKLDHDHSSRFRRGKKNKKFLFVGEIKEHKGIGFLLAVFKNLLKHEKDLQLSIIGLNSEKIKIPDEFVENFHLSGWKSSVEVKQEMLASHCLIVPSLCYENSPTVIYEAAVFGLPVIASRIGGITELVHSLGGILFNPNDEDDLSKKILYAIKNPDIIEKIGFKASENIKKHNLIKYLDTLEKEFRGLN